MDAMNMLPSFVSTIKVSLLHCLWWQCAGGPSGRQGCYSLGIAWLPQRSLPALADNVFCAALSAVACTCQRATAGEVEAVIALASVTCVTCQQEATCLARAAALQEYPVLRAEPHIEYQS